MKIHTRVLVVYSRGLEFYTWHMVDYCIKLE